MGAYVAKRCGLILPTVLGVVAAVFLLMRAVPGDPARLLLGERATPAQLAQVRQEMGLDDPVPVQFARFLAGVLRGDLGRSAESQQPVLSELLTRWPATLELAAFAMAVAVLVGVPVGVLSAVWRNSALDWGTMLGALAGVSMPVFWLGLVLLMLFSAELQWLPAGGRLDVRLAWDGSTEFVLWESLVRGEWAVWRDALAHIALPGLALGTIPLAIVARITRSSMLDVLGQDFIRTARAKGLAQRVVVFRHGLRNALLPVLTVIGLQVGFLLGGAVLTETIFSWPGVGKYSVDAIYARDYPVVQGSLLLTALAVVLVNLAVDLAYTVVDPRIRYQ